MRLSSTLAQGRYEYSCDGRTMPVQDCWQLGLDEHGHRMLMSQRLVGEQGFGMEVRARLQAGLVTECDVRWRDEVDEVHAHYALQIPDGASPSIGDPILARWSGPNGPQEAELEGRNRLLFPLMRIFMGPLLLKLDQHRDGFEVVSPDVVDPSQRGKLLAPRISFRSARPMAGDAATQGAQELGQDISAFIYHGDEAERDAHCFLDSRGLLIGYDWPSSTGRLWQVRLRDLEWSSQVETLV
ncbi:hypothetical protein AUP74_00091 [Microbulbifer aggregans]|uniref:Uncharacterized protein n=1 Tax=Microbulbifer aggregans TaxID=1769779 RepID=A0A1C9W340_9GAMM|nr:hypothetical protein [Microbulbifer aggregans]AOS95568.1 hypothetical protein AUP74_00091 [Microbulbifer aggregans]